ncbi:hypothetical protein [Paenibacillus pinihumi]|uniref:hypothetical protein n=1 Tax=Paenibacillus pinihumi TaxID=669462 RepID=UPI0012B5B13E|nr:hypothetical protein [Paenibacillus pinihumi]
MNRSGFKSNDETTSEFYESFISSVQTLNKALDTVSEASGDEKSVSMFDVYTYMLFVNQRLNFLLDHADSIEKSTTIKNDLFLLSSHYQSQVRSQISDKETFNLEAHLKLKEQLNLFMLELPDKYDESQAFIKQFNKASAHIKPLIN